MYVARENEVCVKGTVLNTSWMVYKPTFLLSLSLSLWSSSLSHISLKKTELFFEQQICLFPVSDALCTATVADAAGALLMPQGEAKTRDRF